MKPIGQLIDKLEKNHEQATPYMLVMVLILSIVAILILPSYEDYCKELQVQCKEGKE